MYLIDFINSTSGMNPNNTLFILSNSNTLPVTNIELNDTLLVLTSNSNTASLTLSQFYHKTNHFPEKVVLVFQTNKAPIQKIWGYRIIQSQHQLLLK